MEMESEDEQRLRMRFLKSKECDRFAQNHDRKSSSSGHQWAHFKSVGNGQSRRTSLKIINDIIHKDLDLVTRKKTSVHQLTPVHIQTWKTNTQKLYEHHFAEKRSEFEVTLDSVDLLIIL